jgi:hypothetical protein
MKKFECDLCHASVEREYELSTLVEVYQLEGVSHLCRPCMKQVEDAAFEMQCVIDKVKKSFIRRFIENLKTKYA